jgi:hypothetical protein
LSLQFSKIPFATSCWTKYMFLKRICSSPSTILSCYLKRLAYTYWNRRDSLSIALCYDDGNGFGKSSFFIYLSWDLT